MQNKELEFGTEARKKILKGINALADAVKVTLGPKGQCVIISEHNSKLNTDHITKDGITVAKNIKFKDKWMNTGANLIRESSFKSNQLVGDGTTSSCVIAQAMINEAERLISDKKINPVVLRKELQASCENVVEIIKDSAIGVNNDDDIKNVATTSANNDSEIGELICDTFKKITKDGVITVEESNSVRTSVDVIQGMQFERGFESPYFVTDTIKEQCILEKPYIIIMETKIESMREIIPLLEQVHRTGKPCLIIAQDYENDVIETLKYNVLNGLIQVCAVKCPSFGIYRKDVLEDIAILTGGRYLSVESGEVIERFELEDLGTCDKVIVTKNTTTIIGGNGSIEDRVQEIKNKLESIKEEGSINEDFLVGFYESRIAKLLGGIATIKVGGVTDLEIKQRKDRVDDAVSATKAAVEEGIVPGGGITYLKAFDCLKESKNIGDQLIMVGLRSVFDNLCLNAGLNSVEEIKYIDPVNNIGIDMNIGFKVNMLDAGIIEPTKVVRLAIENAVSVTNLYLSTGCVIIPEIETFM